MCPKRAQVVTLLKCNASQQDRYGGFTRAELEAIQSTGPAKGETVRGDSSRGHAYQLRVLDLVAIYVASCRNDIAQQNHSSQRRSEHSVPLSRFTSLARRG
jgi:hypothetical protein